MPTGTDQLERDIIDYLRNPRGIGNLGDGLEYLKTASIDVAEASAISAEGPEAEIAVGAFGDFIGDIFGWAVLIAIAGIIVNLKIIEWVLYKMADHAPWPFGGWLHGLVHLTFSPIDNLELYVGQKMADVATRLITSGIRAIRAFLQYELGVTLPKSGGITSSQLTHIQNEINATNARVNQLTQQIAAINAEIHGLTIPSPGTLSLESRVRHLEVLDTVVVHDLNVLHGDVIHLSQNQNVQQRELIAISANLNAVRAVQFGVQDVLTTVENELGNLDHKVTTLEPMVDTTVRQLHVLNPLTLLLRNGMPGLRNLEKLERKPCQCPSFPGLPGDQAGFLALYEFLLNG